MRLFTYGTLKRGFGNNIYLQGSNYIADAELSGYDMYSIDGMYPAIVPGSGTIKGELWEIDERTLEGLDRLEREGEMYKREYINETVVYVWMLGTAPFDRIKTNEWGQVCV